MQALDRQVWTVDKLAAEYGVSKEEIQRWMASPIWDEVFREKEHLIILQTRFHQIKQIANAKMTSLTHLTSLISEASIELTNKVKNGEMSALEALDKSRNLCAAQESGDKTLESILDLEDAVFGISQILDHIQTNEGEV